MAGGITGNQRSRIEATKLFEAARDLAARGQFAEARELYELSLAKYEDPIVRAAYLDLLATIGPM